MSTVVIVGAYGFGQQVYRMSANDPQFQQSAATLANVDFGSDPRSLVGPRQNDLMTSNLTFTIIADEAGKILAADAVVDGAERVPPMGSMQYARQHGVNMITWQPKAGVRLATVIRANQAGDRYVIVGRSLVETERRIANLGKLTWGVWAVATVSTFLVSLLLQPRTASTKKLRPQRRKAN